MLASIAVQDDARERQLIELFKLRRVRVLAALIRMQN